MAIRQEVLDFFSPAPSGMGYFGEYDWIVLRQLVGSMLDWPQAWPLSHMNLEQFRLQSGGPSLPAQKSSLHHALHDARWCREASGSFFRKVRDETAQPASCIAADGWTICARRGAISGAEYCMASSST